MPCAACAAVSRRLRRKSTRNPSATASREDEAAMDMIDPQNRGALQLMLVRLSTALTFALQALPKLFHGMQARADMAHRLRPLGVPHPLPRLMLSGGGPMAPSPPLSPRCSTRRA